MEIIETGALRRVDAERTEDVAAVQLFQGIYGVGIYEHRFSLVFLSFFLPPTQGNRLRMPGILLVAARLKTSKKERVESCCLQCRC
jgi:hypothetical protein